MLKKKQVCWNSNKVCIKCTKYILSQGTAKQLVLSIYDYGK